MANCSINPRLGNEKRSRLNEESDSAEIVLRQFSLNNRLESSPTRTRTLNLAVNSRSLYRLSYRGITLMSIPAEPV